MDRQTLIDRFEAEMSKVQRPGVDKLMEYIRKSDFYTAPASTKYHLSCEGGLLQHSLNVLDALRSILVWNPITEKMEYFVGGTLADAIPEESLIVIALLHDICKTYFYGTSTRNVKNEHTGRWEKVPYYTVEDRMPLGHGDKSVMIIKQYMDLTNREMYAIWWHMGMTGNYENDTAVGASIEKYPIVLALQTADMMASKIMEANTGNKEGFVPKEAKIHERNTGEDSESNDKNAETPDFQEAPALDKEDE